MNTYECLIAVKCLWLYLWEKTPFSLKAVIHLFRHFFNHTIWGCRCFESARPRGQKPSEGPVQHLLQQLVAVLIRRSKRLLTTQGCLLKGMDTNMLARAQICITYVHFLGSHTQVCCVGGQVNNIFSVYVYQEIHRETLRPSKTRRWILGRCRGWRRSWRRSAGRRKPTVSEPETWSGTRVTFIQLL